MKARTKEENAAYARAQRAKRKSITPVSPTVSPITARITPTVSPIISAAQERTTVPPTIVPPDIVSPAILALIKQINRRLDAIDDDLRSLKARMRDIDGGDVSLNQATRPGAHPTELYGA